MRRTPPSGLSAEVEAAVLDAADNVGSHGFSKTACVAQFLDREVGARAGVGENSDDLSRLAEHERPDGIPDSVRIPLE